MANALSNTMAPSVPAALPQPQAQPQGGGMPGMGAPQQQPAPSHAETVTALRHFHAIARELEGLLADPALGRSDIKGKIIDSTTKLVADRILGPGEAVNQLGTVPSDPIEQRKWVRSHFVNVMLAENAVLDHHRAATPGSANWQSDAQMHPSTNSDDHMQTMTSVMGQYRGGRRA
jgi:hypothetical protein